MCRHYIPNRQIFMKFYVVYFYKNVIFFSNRDLRLNINMYVLRTVRMLLLCVMRV